MSPLTPGTVRSVSQAGSPSYRWTLVLGVPNTPLGWRRLGAVRVLPELPAAAEVPVLGRPSSRPHTQL